MTSSESEWASCNATFTYNYASHTWNDITLAFTGPNSTYTFHFKDIKIENLGDIVEKPDILEIGTDAATCWSEGDDLLITSSSHSQNGYVERTITSIDVDAGEITLGSGINPLDNSLLSLADGEEVRKFAVEVASLSRQVKFVAEKDDTDELLGSSNCLPYTSYSAATSWCRD